MIGHGDRYRSTQWGLVLGESLNSVLTKLGEDLQPKHSVEGLVHAKRKY